MSRNFRFTAQRPGTIYRFQASCQAQYFSVSVAVQSGTQYLRHLSALSEVEGWGFSPLRRDQTCAAPEGARRDGGVSVAKLPPWANQFRAFGTESIPYEASPGPPGDPHSFHSFSQFQIPDPTSFGNGNPS